MPVNDVQNAVDNAGEEAKKYRRQLTAELEKVDEGIDAMTVSIKQASANVQHQYEVQLQELKAQRRLVEVKLAEFQESSESALESVKVGLEAAWQELARAFEQVAKDFDSEKR